MCRVSQKHATNRQNGRNGGHPRGQKHSLASVPVYDLPPDPPALKHPAKEKQATPKSTSLKSASTQTTLARGSRVPFTQLSPSARCAKKRVIASVVQADLKFDVNKLVQHEVEKACEKAKQAKQLSRAACLEIALKGDLTDMQYDYLHKSVPDKLVCLILGRRTKIAERRCVDKTRRCARAGEESCARRSSKAGWLHQCKYDWGCCYQSSFHFLR